MIDRAGLLATGETFVPRFREAGDVTLDLFHRDGRVEDRWLALSPREFALLWGLAEQPGERMTRQQLLAAMLRIPLEPAINIRAIPVARVRTKLAPFGLAHLIAVHPDGGYVLDVPPPAGLPGLTGAA